MFFPGPLALPRLWPGNTSLASALRSGFASPTGETTPSTIRSSTIPSLVSDGRGNYRTRERDDDGSPFPAHERKATRVSRSDRNFYLRIKNRYRAGFHGRPRKARFRNLRHWKFCRRPAPEINSNQKFKIGPPSFSFEGNQITKHEGKQSFEYIVTPLVAGLHEIPPIEFSYFDPIQESFVSASTLPHPLQVDRGEQWNPGVQGSNYPKQTVESNRPPVSDLFQAESEPGEWTATLTPSPLMNQPAFWYFQAIPFAGICSLTFWGIRRKPEERKNSRPRKTAFPGK